MKTESALVLRRLTLFRRVSQTEKGKYHTTSLTCGICKEMTQTNLQNRKRLTDLENELMVARESIVRDFGKVMYTLLYLK